MDVAGFRPRSAALNPIGAMVIVGLGWLVGCAMLGPTTATSFLNQIERSPDPNERFKAYEKLASDKIYDNNQQRARAVQVLLAGLDSNKEPVATRAVICRTLGTLGDPAARPAMIRLVRDPEVLVRTEACRSLGKLGRPEDSTVLMQMMTLDSDPDCQVAAIESLGTLKSVDPRTPDYLVRAMDENENPAIRLAALQSLRKITGKNLGVQADAWREYLASKDEPKPAKKAKRVAKTPTLDKAAKPASMQPRRVPSSTN